MGISTSDKPYMTRVEEAEADKFMRVAVAKAQDAQFVKRTAARREMGHWNEWRDLAEQIRQHVIKYLPDYLEEFSNNVERQGATFSSPKPKKRPATSSRSWRSKSRPKRSSSPSRW